MKFSSVHTRVKKSKNVLTGNCHKNATAEKYLLDLTLKMSNLILYIRT